MGGNAARRLGVRGTRWTFVDTALGAPVSSVIGLRRSDGSTREALSLALIRAG